MNDIFTNYIAIEFIDYNIIGFYPPAGVDGPIVMYKLLD